MYRFPNEIGRFHKALPNAKSADVTLKEFTPELQTFCTFLLSIWAKCTSAWVKITQMEYLPRIWAKCTGVWGKITPTKLAVFIKLYPTSEAHMLHSQILPQTTKKFTQIYLPYL